MSMFASRTTDTMPIPFESGQTITLRKLTGGETDAAQEAHLRATIAGRWSPHGWAATFQRQLAKGVVADVQQALTDPLLGYDRLTLATAGIVAWSMSEPALSPEAIADLGDDELDWVAREILRRTKPALFLTVEDAKAAEKELSASASVA